MNVNEQPEPIASARIAGRTRVLGNCMAECITRVARRTQVRCAGSRLGKSRSANGRSCDAACRSGDGCFVVSVSRCLRARRIGLRSRRNTMLFMVMHKMDPKLEAGGEPDQRIIANMG